MNEVINMKRISDWQKFVAEANEGELRSDKLPENSKKRVLDFLKNIEPYAIAACRTTDEISGNSTDIPLCSYKFEDFYWDSRDILYFEKYDMPLYPDFLGAVSQ